MSFPRRPFLRPPVCAPLLALLLAAALPSQGTRCLLLSRLDQHANYLGVTGGVVPGGAELALLSTSLGTAVIDCTLPTAPVELGFFPGPFASARDAVILGRYAYLAGNHAGGVEVVDLGTNPPASLGNFGAGWFRTSSSLCLDVVRGRLYCLGTDVGLVAFDVATNPARPALLGNWLDGTPANFIERLQCRGDQGFAAMPYAGQLRLVDLSVWPPQWLGSTTTPGGIPSHVGTSSSGAFATVADHMGVMLYDTANRWLPAYAGRLTLAGQPTPLASWPDGDWCHVAWGGDGYRLYDAREPANPQPLASYLTAGSAVACYPFLPSGTVLVADRLGGLYLLQPQAARMQVLHTVLGDQADEDGPYTVRAQFVNYAPGTWLSLLWESGSSPMVGRTMQAIGGGLFQADIPGQLAPAVVRYHLLASDGIVQRRLPETGEFEFRVGALRQAFTADFENPNGWTHGASAGVDEWQFGPPRGAAGVSHGVGWLDPTEPFAGSNIAGIDLGGPNSDGAYGDLSSSWLLSPSIPTQGLQHLHLRYRRWLSLGAGDSARVMVNNRVVYAAPSAIQDRGWQLCDIDIGAIADPASSLTVRFELSSDASGIAGGWQLDDVEVYALSDQLPPQHYGVATPGSGGIAPSLDLQGDWHLGTSALLQADQLLGGGAAVLLLGTQMDNVREFGITRLIGPNQRLFWFALASGAVGAPGAGSVGFPLAIPNVPALDNLPLCAQVLCLDSGSIGGLLSSSDGLRFRICAW